MSGRTREADPDELDAHRFRVFAFLIALAFVLYYRWEWFHWSWASVPLTVAAVIVAVLGGLALSRLTRSR